MKKLIYSALVILLIFLGQINSNQTLGQNIPKPAARQVEIKLFASFGTFSAKPKQGHIPLFYSTLHFIKVDSNSMVILKKTLRNSKNKEYIVIGPDVEFDFSVSSTEELVNSNDKSVWSKQIERVKRRELKSISIECSLSDDDLKKILIDNNFVYLPNYPDIMQLDFHWSELTQGNEVDKEISPLTGESNKPLLSDTVSVSATTSENVIHKKLKFLEGKWNLNINGGKAIMNLDSVNYGLNGNIVFQNNKSYDLKEISYFEPFINFNLIDTSGRTPINLTFVARIEKTKSLIMLGIFEKEGEIHTWSAELVK